MRYLPALARTLAALSIVATPLSPTTYRSGPNPASR